METPLTTALFLLLGDWETVRVGFIRKDVKYEPVASLFFLGALLPRCFSLEAID
jgi:hypothetical protein